jgi:hypothetical protein
MPSHASAPQVDRNHRHEEAGEYGMTMKDARNGGQMPVSIENILYQA